MQCNMLAQDVNQKISHSFFRYKGEVVYVRKRNDKGGLTLYRPSQFEERNGIDIHFHDPNFDISSIPLGYMTLGDKVYYSKRKPLRQYKQGVCSANTDMFDLNGKRVDAEHKMLSKGFEDSVNGVFPSADQGIRTLRKKIEEEPLITGKVEYELAISRDIALSIDKIGVIRVFFKQEYVGFVAPDSNIVRVMNGSLGWVVSMYLASVFTKEQIN